MRPLIIDNELRNGLKALKEHAIKNPITEQMVADPDFKPIGDNPNYVFHWPFGYRIVLSYEIQPEMNVFHFSFSVPDQGKLPSVQAVMMLINIVDFKQKDIVNIVTEDLGEKHEAVNVWVT